MNNKDEEIRKWIFDVDNRKTIRKGEQRR